MFKSCHMIANIIGALYMKQNVYGFTGLTNGQPVLGEKEG